MKDTVYRCRTRERPVEDGVEGAAVDVDEDGEEAVCSAVDAVEVDAQTELVAGLTRVEARTVNGRAARRLTAQSVNVADRPHVRTNVLPNNQSHGTALEYTTHPLS